jgi:hypothetical protein
MDARAGRLYLELPPELLPPSWFLPAHTPASSCRSAVRTSFETRRSRPVVRGSTILRGVGAAGYGYRLRLAGG